MATSGPVIARFSEAANTPPSTIDRMLRVLRPAGLAPMGRPGRGTSEGVFSPFHLACLLLGFGGAQPSDAAEAAETLRHFQWHHSVRAPWDDTRTPPELIAAPRIPGTLGEVLEAIIAGGLRPSPGEADDHPHLVRPVLDTLARAAGSIRALARWEWRP